MLAVGGGAILAMLSVGACSPQRQKATDAGATRVSVGEAEPGVPADVDAPAFKRALPPHYFDCGADSDCSMVQGWCATFAVNKTNLEAYKKLPADPKGKDTGPCPPGWLPPNARPICSAGQCAIVSGPHGG
jgi:hypothetical protein